MTTSDPRDRAALSDPRVDAAWRALSDEAPPEALDAAIMAAARREVGAGPQKSATPEAVADRRRWWPFAAAATVATIAVGVLQLATPDQVGTPAPDKAVVTDLPTPAAGPSPEMAAPLSRPEETKPGAGNLLRAEQAPVRADSPRRQAPAPEPLEPVKRESAASTAPAMAEPFPAAPPQPAATAGPVGDAAPAGRIENAAPAASAESSAAAKEAPQPPARAGSATEERAPPMRDNVAPVRILAAPARTPAPAQTQAMASQLSAQRAQENAAAQPVPLAKMTAGRAADSRADEARAKDRAPLPVAEWIVLIRRLRDEGKSADAAKELAAFRVAHADHDKLLPPDLRNWQPPEK